VVIRGGHKNFDDRTINFARLRKDGFLSRDAGKEGGRLLTKVLRMKGGELTVNADVSGVLRLRVLDPLGKPLEGFGEGEVEPIRGDATDHKVTTRGDLASLADRPVRLEFFLRHAEFYGIELHETR
jgi:hypothetical protein